jgi:uncharacterized protein (TIGR00725 family)
MPAVMLGVIGQGTCRAHGGSSRGAWGRRGARQRRLCSGGLGGVRGGPRGAAEAGGVAGILPGFRRQEANRWVTVPIVTGMDQARNVVLVRSCDALIAVGGMYGTLSEIALALKLGVPVVGLGTWRLRQPAGRPVPIIRVATPEAAVARALRAARTARRARGRLP